MNCLEIKNPEIVQLKKFMMIIQPHINKNIIKKNYQITQALMFQNLKKMIN
jgi:hypothetical protein